MALNARRAPSLSFDVPVISGALIFRTTALERSRGANCTDLSSSRTYTHLMPQESVLSFVPLGSEAAYSSAKGLVEAFNSTFGCRESSLRPG